MTDKKIPIITGPTASGKSAAALKLCEITGGELISCDSMQIYKGLDVGTAKPSSEEQALVRHHMIDIVEPGAGAHEASRIMRRNGPVYLRLEGRNLVRRRSQGG